MNDKDLVLAPDYTLVPGFIKGLLKKNDKGVPTFYTKEYMKIETSYDLYCKCRDDFRYALYFWFGINPRDYQFFIAGLMQNYNQIALCLFRRAGKTLLFNAYSLWCLRTNRKPRFMTGTMIQIFGHKKDQMCMLYIENAYKLIEQSDKRTFKVFGDTLGEHFWSGALTTRLDKTGKQKQDKLSMRVCSYDKDLKEVDDFVTCSMWVEASSDNARGGEASIIVMDEVAYFKKSPRCKNDIDFYKKVVQPMTTDMEDIQEICASTPDGFGDLFEYLFDPRKKYHSTFKKIWMPYWYRTDATFLAKMKTMKEQSIKEGKLIEFLQEYESLFVQSKDQYYTADTIGKLFDNDNQVIESSYDVVDIGVDFGGSIKSKTVITISRELETGRLERIYKKTYEVNFDYTIGEDMEDILSRFPNWRYIICDNQGGRQIVKKWQSEYTEDRVIEFQFRANKINLHSNLRNKIQNNIVKSFPDDDLRREMITFTKDMKPRSEKDTDDELDSFALSIWKFSEKINNMVNISGSNDGVEDILKRNWYSEVLDKFL